MSSDDLSTSRRSSLLIYFYLFCSLVIFLMAAFVIYYRFWKTPETNCGLLVKGTSALTNARVVVERVTNDPGLALKLEDTFRPANQFDARFFLPSGTYKLAVLDGTGRTLHAEPGEFIPPGRRLTLDLRRKFATTAPATRPGLP